MISKSTVMIVAGEASGDRHAAKLVNELRVCSPLSELTFFGSAGPFMRDSGVEATIEADRLSIVGLAEIGRALPMFYDAFVRLKNEAALRKPDLVILVDFPEFNLKLAKALKKQGMKVVYYISPQIWAWRKYRIRTIRKYVDLLITILPFEKSWYAERNVRHVEYVGSPLAHEVHAERTKLQFCIDNGLNPEVPIVCLLPGSRHKEIVRILPVMLEAATKMASIDPNIQFVIAMADGRHRSDVTSAINALETEGVKGCKVMKVVEGETYDAMNAADVAAVTSGTATLETGIIGTPMAIVYRTSALNFALLEPLIKVEHYGLINLIAEKRVAKELIQGDFTGESLSTELIRLLAPEENRRMRDELFVASEKLGHGGASARAAKAILRVMDR